MVKYNFETVRGDTLSFDVVLNDLNGESVTSMYFTVKVAAKDEEALIMKSLGNGITSVGNGTWRVRIAPEDTEGIETERQFVYDIQVGIGNDVYTIVMGTIKFIQDVTRI